MIPVKYRINYLHIYLDDKEKDSLIDLSDEAVGGSDGISSKMAGLGNYMLCFDTKISKLYIDIIYII